MRKTVPYVAAWFVAGVAAVAVASLGVSMVGRQVTGSRPAPLSAEQVREELASTGDEPGAGDTTTTAPPGPTVTAGPATTSTTTGGGGSPTTAPTAGGASGPGSPDGVTTTTTAAPPPPAAATTRTYKLVGGTATLRFSAERVTVVVATPKAGFSVDVSESHGDGARVEFEGEDHRSRVDAWWDGGPQDEVREED